MPTETKARLLNPRLTYMVRRSKILATAAICTVYEEVRRLRVRANSSRPKTDEYARTGIDKNVFLPALLKWKVRLMKSQCCLSVYVPHILLFNQLANLVKFSNEVMPLKMTSTPYLLTS
jgi:hypothetical protein